MNAYKGYNEGKGSLYCCLHIVSHTHSHCSFPPLKEAIFLWSTIPIYLVSSFFVYGYH